MDKSVADFFGESKLLQDEITKSLRNTTKHDKLQEEVY